MFNLLHTYIPQPILFQLVSLKIHWYGFLIAIGAVVSFLVVLSLAKKYQVKKDHIYDLTFYLIIIGLIGDRLYYVIYAWEYYSQNLLDIFKIWEGGLAIHGAMIAGLLVIYLFAKKYKYKFWFLTDLVVVALPLAMAFGRWGNYFNQELFGKPTNLPWGIPIEQSIRPIEFMANSHFHPTFLYESLWNLMIFLILFVWHHLRIKKYKNNLEKIQGLGNITLVYFILYSVGRGMNEFLRIDYTPYFFGIRWAQFTSIIIILICLSVIVYRVYLSFSNRSKVSTDSS